MLLKKNVEPKPDYLQDWPNHYYEIDDIAERKEILQKAIELNLDPAHDKYRLKLFERRYCTGDKKKMIDAFMYAWVMIKASSASSISFFNKKQKHREMVSYMESLCLLNFEPECPEEKQVLTEEWNAFAKQFISSCADSRSYRSILFGIATIKDPAVAGKLAAEIKLVTETYPAYLGYAETFLPFRQILMDNFRQMIEDGESYL